VLGNGDWRGGRSYLSIFVRSWLIPALAIALVVYVISQLV